MFSYDSALLAATPVSPQSIGDVLAGMRAMDAVFIDGDGLRWFHRLYLQVTEAVAARLAGGGFANGAWLADLDVQFAGLYFDALRRQLGGQTAPGCWRALFDHRADSPVARIQFALAGVNAHINHDLPFAVVATCGREGAAPRHGSTEYTDYTAVNSTLDSLIDTAKAELMVRLLGDPLPAVSHLEDRLAAWSVSAAREAAWTNGEVMWGIGGDRLLAGRFEAMLDGLTAVAGKTLMAPVPLVLAQAK
jgi:Family of unknown function (DUF5995)